MQRKYTGAAALRCYIHSDHTRDRPVLKYISDGAAQEASKPFRSENCKRMIELFIVMAQKKSCAHWIHTSPSGTEGKCGGASNLSKVYKNFTLDNLKKIYSSPEKNAILYARMT